MANYSLNPLLPHVQSRSMVDYGMEYGRTATVGCAEDFDIELGEDDYDYALACMLGEEGLIEKAKSILPYALIAAAGYYFFIKK